LGGVARRGLHVPGREDFDDALDNLDRPWDGGPLSELARRELATHMREVVGSLADLDRLAVWEDAMDAEAVVTHGEPHPGNLIRTRAGLVLIDWDTVALARPERDLWMIGDADEDVLTGYRDLTGIRLDPEALAAYRLLWALTDIAAFTARLRGEHQRDGDAERALAALRNVFNGREASPYGTAPRQRLPRPDRRIWAHQGVPPCTFPYGRSVKDQVTPASSTITRGRTTLYRRALPNSLPGQGRRLRRRRRGGTAAKAPLAIRWWAAPHRGSSAAHRRTGA
jgi:hypothetical protein